MRHFIVWISFLSIIAIPVTATAQGNHAQQLEEFATLLQRGEMKKAIALLNEPGFLSYVDGDGQTALFAAAYLGSDAVIEAVLAHKPNLQQRDADGATALHYAAAGRGRNAANIMLMAGADPNVADKQGLTPLMTAIINSQHLHANMLIIRRADLDMKDRSGNTALLYAISKKHTTTVSLLLRYGASPTLGRGTVAPIQLARSIGDVQMVQLIEQFL